MYGSSLLNRVDGIRKPRLYGTALQALWVVPLPFGSTMMRPFQIWDKSLV